MTRGATWALALLENAQALDRYPKSVCIVDGSIASEPYRTISVVMDPSNRFPRARSGELGLDEALAIEDAIHSAPRNAAIVAVVDLPGQAYGRREESAGLHVALASVVDAYCTERRNGRQIFALLVGKAISGGFLAHGMQAGWIGSLDDCGVEVHVMSAASVARVTRSNAEEVARIATVIPATARTIEAFEMFGAVDQLFFVNDPEKPNISELATVRFSIASARRDGLGLRAPITRLLDPDAAESRRLAIDVRRRIADAW
jgi:biotin-independent malonate decarboxylase gamma subunit